MVPDRHALGVRMTHTSIKLSLGVALFALAACSEPVPADATEPVAAPSLVSADAPRTRTAIVRLNHHKSVNSLSYE